MRIIANVEMETVFPVNRIYKRMDKGKNKLVSAKEFDLMLTNAAIGLLKMGLLRAVLDNMDPLASHRVKDAVVLNAYKSFIAGKETQLDHIINDNFGSCYLSITLYKDGTIKKVPLPTSKSDYKARMLAQKRFKYLTNV